LQFFGGIDNAWRGDTELESGAMRTAFAIFLTASLALAQLFPFPGTAARPNQITFFLRSSVSSSTDLNAYSASPTYTPQPKSLLVVAAVMGTTGDFPSISGHGLTWTMLENQTQSGPAYALQMWAADAGTSPTSAAVTITRTSGSGTMGIILEFEVTGADTSSGLTSAVVNHYVGTAASGTSISVTLSAAGSSRNRPIAFVGHFANEATTPRTNWTEAAGADLATATPAYSFEGQYRSDAFETTASGSYATSSVARMFALEVKAL
jgi:hypothetical protein